MRTAEEYASLVERAERDTFLINDPGVRSDLHDFAAALREAAEMVRDHEAVEKLRNTPKATFRRSTYGNA